eukprot:gnl/TRDRNA2_/TRDRNA2_152845_c1_seq2.p1 gnl/TRDRNA2_/TRDRNA2_152845_c1~~gnl/TRDRNA2_/TRDRNA2_152845_c1_seq2.p1  ORF type:complete len:139 (-),score=0.14 gnl/TRDRNA2_/TRDRNA2_152845_c1_seq2:276-692(-)
MGVSRESITLVNSSLFPSEGMSSLSTSHKLFLKVSENEAQDATSRKPKNLFGYKDLTCSYLADEFERHIRYFNCGNSEAYCLPLDRFAVKHVAGRMLYSTTAGEFVVGIAGNHALPLASVSMPVIAALLMSLLLSMTD